MTTLFAVMVSGFPTTDPGLAKLYDDTSSYRLPSLHLVGRTDGIVPTRISRELAKKFADLARDAVEARGGRVIELRGDEALAVFDAPAQAIHAAIEFQATCAEAEGRPSMR